jgi:hypothetical protein
MDLVEADRNDSKSEHGMEIVLRRSSHPVGILHPMNECTQSALQDEGDHEDQAKPFMRIVEMRRFGLLDTCDGQGKSGEDNRARCGHMSSRGCERRTAPVDLQSQNWFIAWGLNQCGVRTRPYRATSAPNGSKMMNPIEQSAPCAAISFCE